MKQLKMYRKPQILAVCPLPSGCTVRCWNNEQDTQDWIEMCKCGILAPDATRDEFQHLILDNANIHPKTDVYFIDMDGKPAATITAVMDHVAKLGTVHMVDSFPWARGRGVGTYMVYLVLERMTREGMHWVQLTTDDFRLPAIRSYLRAGFLPVNTDSDMVSRWSNIIGQLGISQLLMWNPDYSEYGYLKPTKTRT